MTGDCVAPKDYFNTKTMTENLLPIRNGCVLDIVSLEKRKRVKNGFFTYELDSDNSKITLNRLSNKYARKMMMTHTHTYLTEILDKLEFYEVFLRVLRPGR
jgi:hypothetical protein